MKRTSINYLLITLILLFPSQAWAGGKTNAQFKLVERFGKNVAGYFPGEYQKKFKVHLEAQAKRYDSSLEKMLTYPEGMLSCYLYIPSNYRRNAKGWGIYIHINSGAKGHLPKDWQKVLAKHKLIYAAPNQAGNNVPTAQRMAVTMDTLATVKKNIKLDPKRIVIGGLSGGGAMATEIAANYPEIFKGCISHARNIMWEPVSLSKSYLTKAGIKQKWQKGMVWPREIKYLTDADLETVIKEETRFVFITGEKDYNHEPILKSFKGWEKRKIPMLILDVPGMGHTVSKAEGLDEALNFILNKKTGKLAEKFTPRHQMYKN